MSQKSGLSENSPPIKTPRLIVRLGEELESSLMDCYAKAECYSYHDAETGESFYSQDFDDWYESPTALVPVSDNGETETYVLILSLNKFGKSFLVVDDYLADPDAQEAIGFELE